MLPGRFAATVDVAEVASRAVTEWQQYSGRLEAVERVELAGDRRGDPVGPVGAHGPDDTASPRVGGRRRQDTTRRAVREMQV